MNTGQETENAKNREKQKKVKKPKGYGRENTDVLLTKEGGTLRLTLDLQGSQ